MRPQPATLDGLTRAPGGVLADGTAPKRGGRRFSAGSKVPERSGVGATHASAITTPASEERQAHSERVRARGSRNSHPGPPVGAGFGRRKTATNPNKDNNSGQPRAQRESAVGVGLSLYGKKDRQKDGGQPRSSKVQQAPRTCCAPFPLSLPSPYACPVALTCLACGGWTGSLSPRARPRRPWDQHQRQHPWRHCDAPRGWCPTRATAGGCAGGNWSWPNQVARSCDTIEPRGQPRFARHPRALHHGRGGSAPRR